MDVSTACSEAIKTWGNIKPLQHLSNTEIGLENGSFTERRKHSYHISYIPEIQKQLILENKIDVDVEAKGKNLAVLKMRKDFQIIN
jgi:UV DNA damage repair endonuclease